MLIPTMGCRAWLFSALLLPHADVYAAIHRGCDSRLFCLIFKSAPKIAFVNRETRWALNMKK